MKLQKTMFASFLLSSIFVFGSCSFSPMEDYGWNLSNLGYGVDFHTDLQFQYLNDDDYENINAYAKGQAELSRPESVRFEWSATKTNSSAPDITSYELQISTNDSFSDYISYTTKDAYYDVYNLQIATEYYWRVSATLENGTTSVSKPSFFTTIDIGPRNIYVDGVTNVRDIGGWKTADGTRVKQGMIYRCGRLNTSISDGIVVDKVEIEITQNGIDMMRDILGIQSELDLRRTDNNEVGFLNYSPLGDDVFYYSCPMKYNVSNILTGNSNMVKEIFHLLADEDNYPVIYHCNIGTDRTGLIAYLINGLMGVPEEDLYRDYLFSNFGYIRGSRDLNGIKNSYIATIKKYPGATLSEKIYNCLVNQGIPEEDLDAIMSILSE